jgi:hypothetical protein
VRNSSTSSSKNSLQRLPWAGLLALALLLVIDRAGLGFEGPWAQLAIDDPNSAAATRLELKRLRAQPPGRPRVIVVGTSQVIDGFDQTLAEKLLPGVYFAKLGFPRFEPFAIRALAGDLIASGATAVCLIASEQDTHRPLRLEPVPGSSAASLAAVWDLLDVTHWRFALENRMSLYRLVATSGLWLYRYRPDLHLAGLEDLPRFQLDERLGNGARKKGDPFRPVALWGADRHFVPPEARRATMDLFPPLMDQWDARIQAGAMREITAGAHVAVQMHLYRRALEVLREAGLEVVLVEGVLHPAARDLYDTGLRQEFAAFARGLEADLGVRFIPLEQMPRFAESDFYDLIHTTRRGAAKITHAMLRGLRAAGIEG